MLVFLFGLALFIMFPVICGWTVAIIAIIYSGIVRFCGAVKQDYDSFMGRK